MTRTYTRLPYTTYFRACCTVFHQPYVVNVWYYLSTYALVHPAHHITQYALGVVVELFLDFLGRPVGVGGDGNGKQLVEQRLGLAFHALLDFLHIDLMVVQGMQGSRCGRRNPGGIAAGLEVADFRSEEHTSELQSLM